MAHFGRAPAQKNTGEKPATGESQKTFKQHGARRGGAVPVRQHHMAWKDAQHVAANIYAELRAEFRPGMRRMILRALARAQARAEKGEALELWREQKQLTPEAAGKILGLPTEEIERIERGEISCPLDLLRKIRSEIIFKKTERET